MGSRYLTTIKNHSLFLISRIKVDSRSVCQTQNKKSSDRFFFFFEILIIILLGQGEVFHKRSDRWAGMGGKNSCCHRRRVRGKSYTARFRSTPSGVMRIIGEVDYAAVSVDPTVMCGGVAAAAGCGVGRARWTFPHY